MTTTKTPISPAEFRRLTPDAAIYYPDSDGEPMADNDAQYHAMVDARFTLEQRYRADELVYVGANMLIYYEEGDATKSVAPDVFVIFGVPKVFRRNYLIWKERQIPAVVFEIASPRTWKADVSWKKGLYQGLGVLEYLLFDPNGELYQPMLQGFRQGDDEIYRPIAALDGQHGERGLRSEVLGLEIWVQPGTRPGERYALRFRDTATGEWLLPPAEAAEGQRVAEARAAAETAARTVAEARAAEAEGRARQLEAELRRLRGQ